MENSQVKHPVEARQATKENVGRWVLGISLIAVIVVLGAIWMFAK